MQRLSLAEWANIFRNMEELDEDVQEEYGDWVEVLYLDSGTSEHGEWCLCHGEELFEDGFSTEKEARSRLNYLENTLL
ncbi:hypothetical protein [Bacillus phage SDFMU_Pbc]|uniref:Uncharacterized protein n=1 Tax=Bacillus phage SDFMU_Pbc TaxID=3076135 RepID=A0AA96KR21_9CAUD|nr:hypothetical protein [Bacillus phage SDFMU_Pbc]